MRKIFLIPLSIFIVSQAFSNGNSGTINDPIFWSDSLSWPNKTVPDSGENVHIPAGITIMLDESPPPLREIVIEGNLQFNSKDLVLQASSILVKGGKLQIGSEQQLFKHQAAITLNQQYVDSSLQYPLCIVIAEGGSLALHGSKARAKSWSVLTRSLEAGDSILTIKSIQTKWEVGDSLVIASSSSDASEAEKIRITEIEQDYIHFTPPIKHFHDGQTERWGKHKWDKRAEIALLSRNIIIRGDAASAKKKAGACLLIKSNAGLVKLEGVAFFSVGQAGILGKYPIFWRGSGYQNGQYIKNCSVRNSFNRAIVLDGTNQLVLEKNTAYSIYNHAYVISENGYGTRNVLRDNLAIDVRKPPSTEYAFPGNEWQASLRNEDCPTGFYIGNPYQILQQNRASGSEEGIGIWYTPFQADEHTDSTATLIFQGNVAHSHSVYDALADSIFPPPLHGYGLRIDAQPRQGERWVFNDFSSYDNEGAGIWNRSADVEMNHFVLGRNKVGCIPGPAVLRNGVIIGNSRTRSQDTSRQYIGIMVGFSGSTPKLNLNNLDFYNITHHAIDIRHPIAPESFIQNISFHDATVPIYYGSKNNWQMIKDWDGSSVERSSFPIKDHQDTFKEINHRSISADRAFYIMSDQHPLITDSCSYEEQWNAFVCPSEHYWKVSISTGEGMPDPTFEHITPLEPLIFIDSQRNNFHFKQLSHQRQQARIPLFQDYQLTWSKHQTNVPDIRFFVEGKPKSSMIINIPYDYLHPYFFRFYGDIIPQSPSEDSLRRYPATCWYKADSSDHLILKLVTNLLGTEEVILFSETFKTDILLNNKPVYLTVQPILTNALTRREDTATFSYELEQTAKVSLHILVPNHSETIEILNEDQKQGAHTILVPRSLLPEKEHFFIYQLKVNGQLHEGPLLIKDDSDTILAEEH